MISQKVVEGVYTRDLTKKRKKWLDCTIYIDATKPSKLKVVPLRSDSDQISISNQQILRPIFEGFISQEQSSLLEGSEEVKCGSLLIMANTYHEVIRELNDKKIAPAISISHEYPIPNLIFSNLKKSPFGSASSRNCAQMINKSFGTKVCKVTNGQYQSNLNSNLLQKENFATLNTIVVLPYYRKLIRKCYLNTSFESIETYRTQYLFAICEEINLNIASSVEYWEGLLTSFFHGFHGSGLSLNSAKSNGFKIPSMCIPKHPHSFSKNNSFLKKLRSAGAAILTDLEIIVSPPRDENVKEWEMNRNKWMDANRRKKKRMSWDEDGNEDDVEPADDGGEIGGTSDHNVMNNKTKLYLKIGMDQRTPPTGTLSYRALLISFLMY